MRIERRAGAGACLVILLALSGCGDDTMAQVSGTVKVDGKLVDNGAIRFEPVDGNTPTMGGMIKDGLYSVKVHVGAMKVSISAPVLVGTVKLYNAPGSKERQIPKESLPPRYSDFHQTVLRLDVTPGKMQKDFDLPTE